MEQAVQLKSLTDLFNSSSTENIRGSTLGLVVDCTAPHRKDIKRDYIMKIKIIDQNFNKEPCSVFIYGSSLEDFPKITQIGDIIYLKRYQFEIWKDTFLQAKNSNKKVAEHIVFSGHPESKSFDVVDSSFTEVSLTKQVDGFLNSINALRKFSKEYFKKNRVPLLSLSSKTASDFDLVLKVTGSEQYLNMYKVHLESGKEKFTMNYREYVYDGVYKVRSIASVEWFDKEGVLVGNDYTNFIQVPDWMKSYSESEWEKIPRSVGNAHKNLEKPLSTVITNKKLKVTPLRDLITREQHPNLTLVQVEFIDVPSGQFEGCLRKYDAKNRTQKPYTSENGEYVYYINFLVRDSSLDNGFVNVFLYTYDGKGLEFLPGLNPDNIYGSNILNYKEGFENIKTRLLEETSSDKPLQLLLEPMFGKNNVVYRIVDTKLVI